MFLTDSHCKIQNFWFGHFHNEIQQQQFNRLSTEAVFRRAVGLNDLILSGRIGSVFFYGGSLFSANAGGFVLTHHLFRKLFCNNSSSLFHFNPLSVLDLFVAVVGVDLSGRYFFGEFQYEDGIL